MNYFTSIKLGSMSNFFLLLLITRMATINYSENLTNCKLDNLGGLILQCTAWQEIFYQFLYFSHTYLYIVISICKLLVCTRVVCCFSHNQKIYVVQQYYRNSTVQCINDQGYNHVTQPAKVQNCRYLKINDVSMHEAYKS